MFRFFIKYFLSGSVFAVRTCPSIFRRYGETTLVVVEPTNGRERCRGLYPSFFSFFSSSSFLFICNVLFRVACSRSPLLSDLRRRGETTICRHRTDRRPREAPRFRSTFPPDCFKCVLSRVARLRVRLSLDTPA